MTYRAPSLAGEPTFSERKRVKSSREWKDYYARERAELGEAGLSALLDRATAAERLPLSGKSALVFPHTRLADSGHLAASVALAVVRAGCDEVVALGILHGAREADARSSGARVKEPRRARRRSVASTARASPGDAGYWAEEFSLDGFCALVEAAAKREGKKAPRVVAALPFPRRRAAGRSPRHRRASRAGRSRRVRWSPPPIRFITARATARARKIGSRARIRRPSSSRAGRLSAASARSPRATSGRSSVTPPRFAPTFAIPARSWHGSSIRRGRSTSRSSTSCWSTIPRRSRPPANLGRRRARAVLPRRTDARRYRRLLRPGFGAGHRRRPGPHADAGEWRLEPRRRGAAPDADHAIGVRGRIDGHRDGAPLARADRPASPCGTCPRAARALPLKSARAPSLRSPRCLPGPSMR